LLLQESFLALIPDSFIQDLLNRVDIVDVVERYVPLKKAGQNYQACCPFHSEKTPSFTVSPIKQFYHCFGCGAHGTAISFLMEHSGMSFPDAVKDLASGVGMRLPSEEPTPADRKAAQQKAMVEALDLPAVMQLATRFYRSQLKSSTRAINYLKKRGLTGEVAARFGLGYAPDAWQSLESIFTDYPKNPALLESGLVIDNDSGRRYDRFRDRIMFPIVNQRGAIIGFGGRVLDSGEPKYLNSPETVLFEKGRELYGLYQARQAIRDAGKVIVVEGYMDVVSLAQFGVNYAVATLGTSTTPTHVQKLLRQTDRVVFCFDGDNAGRKAAWRALENALPFMQDGKALDFLFLPQDEDPDSYVRHFGKDRFEQLLSEDSVPLTGFLLSELASRVDMQSDSGRASLLHSAKPLLAQIAAPALNLMLRSRLAELVGVAQDELDRLFGIRKARSDKKMTAQPRTPRQPPSVTRQLLQWLLQYPQLATTLHLPESNQEEIAAISAVRQFCLDCDSAPSLGQIMESVRGTPAEQLVRQTARLLLEEAPVLSEEEAAQEMASLVERLQARLRSDQLEYLQRKAQQSGLTDEEKMQMLELLKR
jgi:DNA primase